MCNKLKKGTGLSMHGFNRKEKTISIDLSGNTPKNTFFDGIEGCLRNDASILFFAANSYKSCFNIISKTIADYFNNEKCPQKMIEKLILPYYFNFRHFVELSLKAIIATISGYSPETTHKLNALSNRINSLLSDYKYNNADVIVSEEQFNVNKQEAMVIFSRLSKMIEEYCNTEPSDEFYRYIFETEGKGNRRHIVLNNPTISLNYNDVDKKFHEIETDIYEFCKILSFIKYTYFLI